MLAQRRQLAGLNPPVIQRFHTAAEAQARWELTKNVQVLDVLERTLDPKPSGQAEKAKSAGQGIGILATIPTTPTRKGVDAIGATYAQGFADPAEALLRFGLVVGVNAWAGLGNRQVAALATRTAVEAATPQNWPVAIVSFGWARQWQNKLNRQVVSEPEMRGELADMPDSEREKLGTLEKADIPYGTVRETIAKAPVTGQMEQLLLQRSPAVDAVYHHVADDDAPSTKAPPDQGGRGVYDVYQSEILDQWKHRKTVPLLLAGGYRVRRRDNAVDPGDAPDGSSMALPEYASDLDQDVRDGLSDVDPRIPYLSEANLLVHAGALRSNQKAPNDSTQGEIFGKYTFESGNLKRFLGLNALPRGSDVLKQSMHFMPEASLVTGTGGGGKRFIEYGFKQAKNTPGSGPAQVAQEHRKAISTSQNVGSLGNAAVNLSLYFKAVHNWQVSSRTLCERLVAAAEVRFADAPLTIDALKRDPATREMLRGTAEDAFPQTAEVRNEIKAVIDASAGKILAAHAASMLRLPALLKGHLGGRDWSPGTHDLNALGDALSDLVLPAESYGAVIALQSLVYSLRNYADLRQALTREPDIGPRLAGVVEDEFIAKLEAAKRPV
ncbi:hypothetical protein ABE85_09795 [Mitsuaria sp. 7]|nr:hypothetical protein ABE85_09795 [Mitsuaria sp. 7]